MAFPWISYANFEDGTKGTFTSETDTDGKLTFPHYSEIYRTPGLAMPWRGAYAMQIDLAGGTADAYVQEDTDWDMAASETQYWRWMMWVDPKLVMATTNEFIIFQLQSTGPVSEAVIALNYTTANGLRIGAGETAATVFLDMPQGEWVTVEVAVTLDGGAGNDGTLDLIVNGSSATQVASLDQGAVVQGRLGAMGIDAGTTAGVLMFDDVISDDAQVYPPVVRFPSTLLLTQSGHAFVGPGIIDNITLLSGAGTDCVLEIYDTDTANTNDASNVRAILKNTAANEIVDPAGMPVNVIRGAYIAMSGTTPRALINLKKAVGYSSEASLRSYASAR